MMRQERENWLCLTNSILLAIADTTAVTKELEVPLALTPPSSRLQFGTIARANLQGNLLVPKVKN